MVLDMKNLEAIELVSILTISTIHDDEKICGATFITLVIGYDKNGSVLIIVLGKLAGYRVDWLAGKLTDRLAYVNFKNFLIFTH